MGKHLEWFNSSWNESQTEFSENNVVDRSTLIFQKGEKETSLKRKESWNSFFCFYGHDISKHKKGKLRKGDSFWNASSAFFSFVLRRISSFLSIRRMYIFYLFHVNRSSVNMEDIKKQILKWDKLQRKQCYHSWFHMFVSIRMYCDEN